MHGTQTLPGAEGIKPRMMPRAPNRLLQDHNFNMCICNICNICSIDVTA